MSSAPSAPLIFLLDDDPLILRLLETALTGLGTVEAASLWSEISTRLIAAGRRQDVILVCDINMPGMDGREFCHIVRKFSPKIRIVIFSGTSDEEQARGPFADEVVFKREGLPVLMSAVQAQVDWLSRGRTSELAAEPAY